MSYGYNSLSFQLKISLSPIILNNKMFYYETQFLTSNHNRDYDHIFFLIVLQ
jgi:hypothetical protein